MKRILIALLLAVLVESAATACSGGARDKAGGDVAPITLTADVDTLFGMPGARLAEEFARRVSSLSHGGVKVSIDWSTALSSLGPTDIERVREGKAAVGVVATRTFDVLGVTSLRALQAPFLVTSDKLADAVATDPVAKRMLDGLDRVGLVGLALAPEGLRHPFARGAPLLAPTDFHGSRISRPVSRTTDAILRALAVTPTDNPSTRRIEGNLANPYPFSFSDLVASGNVTFFVKDMAIVVNRSVFDRLSDGQRAVLRRAAVEARDWSIANRPTDLDLARQWCRQGGTIRNASPADLTALERATAPVTAELERDPGTAKAIARIRELKRSLGPQPTIAPCGTHPAIHVVPLIPSGAQTVLDGTWQVQVSRTKLRAAGVPAEAAALSDGTWILTIGAGRVAAVRSGGGRCGASIFIRRRQLSWVWDPGGSCKDDFQGTFTRAGDAIHLFPVTPRGYAVRVNSAFFGHGMHRTR